MASGNIFLGLGRKSIGDVTLYRTRGVQRARARVRVIKNPRSVKQLVSRAAVGNISQLYSLGRALFDHSFQGYSQGQENQLRFQKVNVARLRQYLTDDYNNPQELTNYGKYKARIGARGIPVAAPFVGMQVSEGSYQQRLFTYDADDKSWSLPAPSVSGIAAKTWAADNGVVPGDIYTVVAYVQEPVQPVVAYGQSRYQQLFQSTFKYVQLMVKDGILGDESVLTSDSPVSAVFEIFAPFGTDLGSLADDFVLEDFISGANQGVAAIIRSRFDQDLRSTSYTVAVDDNSPLGLTIADISNAWGDTPGGIVAVDKILEGEDFVSFNPAPAAVDAVPDLPWVRSGGVIKLADGLTWDQLRRGKLLVQIDNSRFIDNGNVNAVLWSVSGGGYAVAEYAGTSTEVAVTYNGQPGLTTDPITAFMLAADLQPYPLAYPWGGSRNVGKLWITTPDRVTLAWLASKVRLFVQLPGSVATWLDGMVVSVSQSAYVIDYEAEINGVTTTVVRATPDDETGQSVGRLLFDILVNSATIENMAFND